MIIARHLTIEGRVQGVGYRAWAETTANEIGVAGWVKNCSDGMVEAVVEGDADNVDAFVEAAWRGPSLFRVSNIVAEEVGVIGLSSFTIRPSGLSR